MPGKKRCGHTAAAYRVPMSVPMSVFPIRVCTHICVPVLSILYVLYALMYFYRHSRNRGLKTAVLQRISAVPIGVPILMKERWERSRLYHGVSIRKYGTRIVILLADHSGTISCMTQLGAPGCAGRRVKSCATYRRSKPCLCAEVCAYVCFSLYVRIRVYACLFSL